MGNSKAYRKRFFLEHPYCCFCGGSEKAVNIEHMPSRTVFIGKLRPKGFEFPICKPCNDVSRKSEVVVAFLSMSALAGNADETLHADVEKHAMSLANNCPETLEEILAGTRKNLILQRNLKKSISDSMVVVTTGDTTMSHLRLFAAKLGLATYYLHTKKIITNNGGVLPLIQTKVDVITGTMLRLPQYMSEFQTLNQGTWNVRKQFSYRYAITENQDAALFQYIFHNNLVVTTFVFEDMSRIDSIGDDKLDWLRPSQLTAVETVWKARLPTISKSFTL